MSNDRELLELAAKAAGIVYVAMDNWPHQDGCRFWKHGDFCDCGAAWNPRDDDGDALRLAIAMGFIIDVRNKGAPAYRRFNRVCYWLPMRETEHHRHIAVDETGDLDAAVRLAIVRAAAEIGKAMP